ncbi:MAG TPA: heme-binding domain-containing protein [Bryobacteraceae bacterium]
MRNRWKWGIGVVVVILVIIQLIRPAHDNPPITAGDTIQARLPVDPVVDAMLVRSCNDCHSNRTVWPWYTNVAPASWLIVSDVRRGRAELNFSEWGTYPPKKQQKLLKETCEEASERKMPVAVYTLLHPSARFTDTDIAAVCAWTRTIAQGWTQPPIGVQ